MSFLSLPPFIRLAEVAISQLKVKMCGLRSRKKNAIRYSLQLSYFHLPPTYIHVSMYMSVFLSLPLKRDLLLRVFKSTPDFLNCFIFVLHAVFFCSLIQTAAAGKQKPYKNMTLVA